MFADTNPEAWSDLLDLVVERAATSLAQDRMHADQQTTTTETQLAEPSCEH